MKEEFSFTEEALQRSTYLFERDTAGSVKNYKTEFEQWLRISKREPTNYPCQSTIEGQLNSHSSLIASGEIPEWVCFLSQLSSEPLEFRCSHVGSSTHRILGDYFSSEAYALPFLSSAESFIDTLDRRYRDVISTEARPHIYAGLIKWYVSKMIQTARYVLHLTYSKSSLTYSDWCKLFQDSKTSENPWHEIAKEFPVLIRWLAIITSNSMASIEEMLLRLHADRDDLELQFSLPRSAKLSAIGAGLSDPHRCGRSVIRLSFESGLSIIYKPKPMNIEDEFNKFAFEHQKILGIAALRVLPRSNYGWVEDAGTLSEKNSLLHYSQSIGRATACFWLLNATDLHFENVKPSSKGVYALDLETLLAAPATGENFNYEPLWKHHSINATLLFNASAGINKKLLNISGFDPAPNFVPPSPQIQFVLKNNTVQMSVLDPEKKGSGVYSAITNESNAAHFDTIVESFKEMLQSDDKALIEKFVLQLDDKCTLRLVLRDTYFYGRILDRMRQPRFMRDGALLSLDLLALHAGISGKSPISDIHHEIVDDEILQLLLGDIPYFSYSAGDLELNISTGKVNFFFEKSAKEHSLSKIRTFETSDVDEQAALLSIALGARPPEKYKPISKNSLSDQPETDEEIFYLELMDFAEKIAFSAFCPSNSPARWLSLFGDISGKDLTVAVGDRGFFGGSWGILLALQAVEKALVQRVDTSSLSIFLDEQAALWSKSLEHIIVERQRPFSEPLGFSGLGGEIFAQTTLISLANERWFFLRPHLGQSLIGIDAAIRNDKLLDVIGGVAGLILGCDQLIRSGVTAEWVPAAMRLQQISSTRLLESAREVNGGLAWMVPGEDEPLLGFAHGWSGIVAALACAARRTCCPIHTAAIQSCLSRAAKYPQALFYAHQEWRDHREGVDNGIRLNRSWCNGEPGFLRGMLEVQDHWGDYVGSGVDSLVEHIRSNLGAGGAYRFCCGEMGNIDFLLDYSSFEKSAEMETEVITRVPDTIREIVSLANSGTKRQMPELTFPGLFQGQSGIAYCAARSILPDLPSLSGQQLSEICAIS